MVIVFTNVTAAEIKVSPDRNPVRINESFTLTFTAPDSPDGDPDFSVLESDFEILNQSQSSNISMINGSFSKSLSWTLTLMAKRTGRLLVPSVPFGQDQSQPLHLEVLGAVSNDADDEADLLLEASAQPENPYVQAQVIYKIQFLRRVDIAQATLSEPVLENAVVQKLDDDRSFTVRRNGHQYAVTERRYAIFPQESGLAAIPPLELKAEVMNSERLGFFQQHTTRMRRIQSNAVALEVRPVPAEFKGDRWFPAEQVVLAEQWSTNPPAVKVGEPLTLTVKLTATGAPLSLLPEMGKLRFKDPNSNAFKQYPDQPVLEEKKSFSGIVGSREQKVALIPSSPGSFHSEDQEIVWWNTRTDRMETTRVPGFTIQAMPGAPGAAANSGVEPSKQDNPDDPEMESSKPPAKLSASHAGAESGTELWFWISVFLALGWGSTLIILAIRRFSADRRKQPEESADATNERHAIRALKTACRDHHALAAKEALLAWSRARWPYSPPRNLDALAALCGGTLAVEIRNLNRALYSREDRTWSGKACWEAFSVNAGKQTRQQQTKRKPELEPLFKA